MKKILVVLMSLAGMITGLALTSCGGGGGGGGGGNLSGTTIVANGPASAYKVTFVEREKGQAYQATISDKDGSKISEMLVSVERVEFAGEDDKSAGNISYLKGSTAPASLESNNNAAFYEILTGIVSTNNAITQLYFPEPMTFIYDEKQGTIHWKGRVSFTAIADNVEQEVETEINRADFILYVTKE